MWSPYLAAPIRQPGAVEITMNGAKAVTRCVSSKPMTHTPPRPSRRIADRALRLRYMLESEERAGYLLQA
jgi:hypothetical protein